MRSGVGGIRCHSTEGVAEERRGGGSGSGRQAGVGSGSGRRAGVGSVRGSLTECFSIRPNQDPLLVIDCIDAGDVYTAAGRTSAEH